ncbi:MAG: sulfatase-like hydrolase/transferase [Acidobacteriaceae bacterium]
MQSKAERRSILGFCTLAILTLTCCKSAPKKENSGTELKPINVVLITLDTVRADHLHCYGYEKIKTPNIDSLAANGVQFEKAVAQTPLTQPSHASMFTGTNPNVNHVRNNGGFALQPSSITMATILQRHGWNTAGFVSSSVLKKIFGFNQGFAFYDDRLQQDTSGQQSDTRPANVTVDHAIQWLNAQTDRPFFLWLHLYDAHQPYDAPAKFDKEYPGDPYDAAIAYEDSQLGIFLNALKRKSPADKTLIVLLSDHGQSLGEHGEYEHGVFLYDATIRIAWIMDGPQIPAGVRIQQQAREIDLLPTVLDLLGGKASSAVQGTNLAPAFSGKAVPTTYSYEETMCPKINMGWSELRGIHTADWMYIRAPKPELYNLDQDPGELNNILSLHPKKYRELEAELNKLSLLGANNTETVVSDPMDQATRKQLESLGYASGFSGPKVAFDGKGDDPKDHIATLKTLETIAETGNISTARQNQLLRQALSTGVIPSSLYALANRKIDLLRQALKSDPADPTLYEWLIDAYEHIGQYPQAMQACVDALHRNIDSGVIVSRIAHLYLREGNLKQAAYYYQRAEQVDPLNVEGQNDLASAYLQIGRLADAERIFRWELAIGPYAPAYNGLGMVTDKRNDLTTARRDFERAVQLDPAYAGAQLNLGIICAQMHDIFCARTAFRAFLANAPAGDGNDIRQVKAVLARMQ